MSALRLHRNLAGIETDRQLPRPFFQNLAAAVVGYTVAQSLAWKASKSIHCASRTWLTVWLLTSLSRDDVPVEKQREPAS